MSWLTHSPRGSAKDVALYARTCIFHALRRRGKVTDDIGLKYLACVRVLSCSMSYSPPYFALFRDEANRVCATHSQTQRNLLLRFQAHFSGFSLIWSLRKGKFSASRSFFATHFLFFVSVCVEYMAQHRRRCMRVWICVTGEDFVCAQEIKLNDNCNVWDVMISGWKWSVRSPTTWSSNEKFPF